MSELSASAVLLDSDDMDDWFDVPQFSDFDSDWPTGRCCLVVGVTASDGRRWRIDLFGNSGCLIPAFTDVRCFGEHVYIGCGARLIVQSMRDGGFAHHVLDGYFGHFFSAQDLEAPADADFLFAASASELLRFTRDGRLAWRSERLGIDGVIVHRVDDGLVRGDGEWDPPGGWRPFAVRLETGEVVRD